MSDQGQKKSDEHQDASGHQQVKPQPPKRGPPYTPSERRLIIGVGVWLLVIALLMFKLIIDVWPTIQPEILNACKLRFEAVRAAVISGNKSDAVLIHGLPFSMTIFPSGAAQEEWGKLKASLPKPAPPSSSQSEGKSVLPAKVTNSKPATGPANRGKTISIYCLDGIPLFVGTRLFFFDVVLSPTILFVLTVMAFGAVGAVVYLLMSYAKHLGLNDFGLAWFAWYVTLPFVGAALGATVYVIFRAGYLPTGDNVQINPFGFAATAALAGLFSRAVFEKLRSLANEIFTNPDKAEKPSKSSSSSDS